MDVTAIFQELAGWVGGGLYQTCLEISGGLQGVEKGLIVMS